MNEPPNIGDYCGGRISQNNHHLVIMWGMFSALPILHLLMRNPCFTFDKFQGGVIKTSIWGIFWNPSYGHPWTIPKTISEITTSFSCLTISFLS
jgi:hypothetical protein